MVCFKVGVYGKSPVAHRCCRVALPSRGLRLPSFAIGTRGNAISLFFPRGSLKGRGRGGLQLYHYKSMAKKIYKKMPKHIS